MRADELTVMKTFLQSLITSLLLVATVSFADQPSYSQLSISARIGPVLALHTHEARAWQVAHSTIQLINEESGTVIREFASTPFTHLIVDTGEKYFAGLSYLQASSYAHGYNFALFDVEGRVLAKAFILNDSGHCESANQTVSQYVFWFDQKNPTVIVEERDGEIRNILVSAGDLLGGSKKQLEYCNIPPGDHSRKPGTTGG